MTQRLARSSRTPVLKFPPAKNAAPDIAKVASASAVSAGWEKNAENPPQPSTARPRSTAVAPRIIVSRALGVARISAIAHSICSSGVLQHCPLVGATLVVARFEAPLGTLATVSTGRDRPS